LFLDPNIFTFKDFDEMTFIIPSVFKIESLPKEINYSFSDNKLIMKRELIMKGGIFPPNEYANLVSFIKQINKADQSKVVFVK
jgi:hypothetical protein